MISNQDSNQPHNCTLIPQNHSDITRVMTLLVRNLTRLIGQCETVYLKFPVGVQPIVSDAVPDVIPSASPKRPLSGRSPPSDPFLFHVLPFGSCKVVLKNESHNENSHLKITFELDFGILLLWDWIFYKRIPKCKPWAFSLAHSSVSWSTCSCR